MEYKKLMTFEIFSLIFTLILGTLLHFTFEWFGKNPYVASFSAINESTWEHLKLVFFPMLLTTIIGLMYFGKQFPNFLCAKTLGIIVAIAFITIFFYTYTGIVGTNYAILDIGSFFVAVFLGEYIAYRTILGSFSCSNWFSGLILLFLFIGFVVFTYFPPKINYFKDPVTHSYGTSSSLS